MSKTRKAAATLMLMGSVNTVGLRDVFGCCHRRAKAIAGSVKDHFSDREFREECAKVRKGLEDWQENLDKLTETMDKLMKGAEEDRGPTCETSVVDGKEVEFKVYKDSIFCIVYEEGKQIVTMLPRTFYLPGFNVDEAFEFTKEFYASYKKESYVTEITVSNPSPNGSLKICAKVGKQVFGKNREVLSDGLLVLNSVEGQWISLNGSEDDLIYVEGQWVGLNGGDRIYDQITKGFKVLIRNREGEWIASRETGFVPKRQTA